MIGSPTSPRFGQYRFPLRQAEERAVQAQNDDAALAADVQRMFSHYKAVKEATALEREADFAARDFVRHLPQHTTKLAGHGAALVSHKFTAGATAPKHGLIAEGAHHILEKTIIDGTAELAQNQLGLNIKQVPIRAGALSADTVRKMKTALGIPTEIPRADSPPPSELIDDIKSARRSRAKGNLGYYGSKGKMRSTLTGSQEDLIRTGEQTESNLRLQQFLAQQKAKSTAEAVERMENAPGSSGRWANRFKQVSNSQASKASQLGSQRMGLMTERNALTSNIKSHFEPDRFDPKVESAQAYLERHAIDSSQIPKSAGKQVRRKKVRGRKAT